MDDESPMELLYAALNSPLGVVVQTSDPARLRQRLYAERKKDPELACISILASRTAPASDLWLVKKETPNAEEPGLSEGDT